jgi:hypothetical protein
MKRLLVALALTVALLLGSTTTTEPAAADYVASRTTYEICVWGGAIYHGSHWPVYAWRTLHYGTAHVTQCWYKYKWDTRYNACLQYVWGPGVAKPYWDSYGSGGACW